MYQVRERGFFIRANDVCLHNPQETNESPSEFRKQDRLFPIAQGSELADQRTGYARSERSALSFYRSGAFSVAAARRRFRNLSGATDLDAPFGEIPDPLRGSGGAWTMPNPWSDRYRPTQAKWRACFLRISRKFCGRGSQATFRRATDSSSALRAAAIYCGDPPTTRDYPRSALRPGHQAQEPERVGITCSLPSTDSGSSPNRP